MSVPPFVDDAKLPLRLSRRLLLPLPGRAAQASMAPPLSCGRHFDPPLQDARRAAVIALLYPREGQWHLPLVLRPEEMTSHAAQVGLPGGLIEPDEDAPSAALRELEEELGVRPGDVALLGPLTPLTVFVSNFHVAPWLGWVAARPDFRPNSAEVAELLELPAAALLDPALRGRHRRVERGIELSVPHFACGRHFIWGATGMLLAELADLLNECRPLPPAEEFA